MREQTQGSSWLRLVLLGVAVYFSVVFMLAFLQRSLIYFPARAASIRPADAGLSEDRVSAVQITSDDGLTLHGWQVSPTPHTPSPIEDATPGNAIEGPAILYFPGNAGHRGYRGDELRTLADLGADVFLIDYRGYGENAGRPTEANLTRDAMSVWRYLVETRGIDPSQIILFGESLGGGVAVRLAADACRDGSAPGGLILRSSFSSLVDVAAHHYPWMPVRLLLLDRFESQQHIADVTSPILMIHGSRDSIAPIRYARQLFDAAPMQSADGHPKRFAELDGADHNDIPYVSPREYRAAMADFLEAVIGD
ncbi:MAG: alpha/beta hydrolase [Planctomycetaceae bacterium]|nr:MAG: alpha/beta hydrolase [Planctomycetaceae bacterium]